MNNESISAISFGFFGKLPQYPDFIKYKASSEEFVLFDEWLQKGIAAAKLKFGNSWKDIYNKSTYFDFIFPVKKNNKILLGVLNSSSDKSGRQFPFVIFSILADQLFTSANSGTLPLVLNSFYYRAKQLFINAGKLEDLNQINSEFNKAEAKLNPSLAAENIFNEYLDTTSVFDFLNRTDIKSSVNNIDNHTEKKSFTINFNTDDENYNFDTGFIIHLLSLVHKKTEIVPYMFKTMTPECKVNLSINFNEPEQDEYAKIISNEIAAGNVFDSLLNTNDTQVSLKKFLNAQFFPSN